MAFRRPQLERFRRYAAEARRDAESTPDKAQTYLLIAKYWEELVSKLETQNSHPKIEQETDAAESASRTGNATARA